MVVNPVSRGALIKNSTAADLHVDAGPNVVFGKYLQFPAERDGQPVSGVEDQCVVH